MATTGVYVFYASATVDAFFNAKNVCEVHFYNPLKYASDHITNGGFFMDKIIITTKGTNNKTKVSQIIFIILNTVLGVGILLLYYYYLVIHSLNIILFLVGGILFLIDGLIISPITILHTASYIDIYEDKITGKYIKNFKLSGFSVKNSQITNITTKDTWIYIYTLNDIYKVMTTTDMAKKVYLHFNK